VVGQRKGPSGANAPPVHGIKKYLAVVVNTINIAHNMYNTNYTKSSYYSHIIRQD
jgi:hypothetical protein